MGGEHCGATGRRDAILIGLVGATGAVAMGRARRVSQPPASVASDAGIPARGPDAGGDAMKKALRLGALFALLAGIGKMLVGRRHKDEEEA